MKIRENTIIINFWKLGNRWTRKLNPKLAMRTLKESKLMIPLTSADGVEGVGTENYL
jgi:hypothetical protein